MCWLPILLPLPGVADHTPLHRKCPVVRDERPSTHPTRQAVILPPGAEPRMAKQPSGTGLQRSRSVVGEPMVVHRLQNNEDLVGVWRLR